MDYGKEALRMHRIWKGKLEIKSKIQIKDKETLSLAYTPGVAQPCLEIRENKENSYDLTGKGNTVAVISNGTAVLGLGNIGADAAMPVMEGKCILLKEFGDINAIPLCIDTEETDVFVQTVAVLANSFGGINLEDIAAPECFEIERRLRQMCDIPVFHDDQHGTAIVCLAAVINALKIVKKDIGTIKVVISGAGAAGVAIGTLLLKCGLKNLIMCDIDGIIYKGRNNLNAATRRMAEITNFEGKKGTLADAMKGADVFVGVSAPGIVSFDMVKTMADQAILFPMANPDPEIMPEIAKEAGAVIVGTGRSDYPNQINNVLAFPGVFRGALDVRASEINEDMEIAAAYALAGMVSEEELNADYILPLPFDPRVKEVVSQAVQKAAINSGVPGSRGNDQNEFWKNNRLQDL